MSWLGLFVKCLELGQINGKEIGSSFAHEVGTIPTKDGRAKEVFEHLNDIHPSVVCLFDGDAEGDRHTAEVCGLRTPPRVVIRWPQGWAIENVVGWVVDAAPVVLQHPHLSEAGIPITVSELVEALRGTLRETKSSIRSLPKLS